MELVDFLDLESKARKGVWVRDPPSGPNLLLDILLVVCYNLFMILWEDGRVLDWSFLDKTCSVCGCNLGLTKQSKKTKCESCKKKELDKDRKEEYNFYQPMYEEYKIHGWQYVKDKYEYPYSHSNFILTVNQASM